MVVQRPIILRVERGEARVGGGIRWSELKWIVIRREGGWGKVEVGGLQSRGTVLLLCLYLYFLSVLFDLLTLQVFLF